MLRDTDTHVRFAKYLVSGLLAILTIAMVFITFSYYAARRDLDIELETVGGDSFEWLYHVQRNNTSLALARLETRCTERLHLAAFRLLPPQDSSTIENAYQDEYKARLAVFSIFKTGGTLIDLNTSLPFLTDPHFDMSELDKYLKPLTNVREDDERYVAFRKRMSAGVDEYNRIVSTMSEARELLLNKYNESLEDGKNAIRIMEERLRRLSNSIKPLTDEQEKLATKYAMWTESLLGSVPAKLLNEFGVDPNLQDQSTTNNIDCSALAQSFRLISGIDLRHTANKKSDGMQSVDLDDISIPPAPDRYQRLLVELFKLPPVAQTLLVTLMMGTLGAVTLNLLRLSRFGWWGTRDDPKWGEVVFGPFLGAIAALGIFLIASTGLLLTTGTAGQVGAMPLSALFIGLLGFISGLLYDEAFGQVRRVGARYFGGEVGDATGPSELDRDLAKQLTDAGAPIAAAVVLAARAGERLTKHNEFTFFVPPDSEVSKDILEACLKVQAGGQTAELLSWLDGHTTSEKLSTADMKKKADAGRIEVTMKNGGQAILAGQDDRLTIGGVTIHRPEILWRKGVIHMLEHEFTPKAAKDAGD